MESNQPLNQLRVESDVWANTCARCWCLLGFHERAEWSHLFSLDIEKVSAREPVHQHLTQTPPSWELKGVQKQQMNSDQAPYCASGTQCQVQRVSLLVPGDLGLLWRFPNARSRTLLEGQTWQQCGARIGIKIREAAVLQDWHVWTPQWP